MSLMKLRMEVKGQNDSDDEEKSFNNSRQSTPNSPSFLDLGIDMKDSIKSDAIPWPDARHSRSLGEESLQIPQDPEFLQNPAAQNGERDATSLVGARGAIEGNENAADNTFEVEAGDEFESFSPCTCGTILQEAKEGVRSISSPFFPGTTAMRSPVLSIAQILHSSDVTQKAAFGVTPFAESSANLNQADEHVAFDVTVSIFHNVSTLMFKSSGSLLLTR